MALSVERSCSMIVAVDKPCGAAEIKSALQGSDDAEKTKMLKKAIAMSLSGEQIPGLFITVIRDVLLSKDKTVQRLLLFYLETIEKTDSSGKLLPEMILICQNLRNNLQHPNEYIRGVTLRFLCRIREEDILEPLVPAILENLEHRHSFVRRNAVLCLNELYRLPKGELLFQDAPEMITNFLNSEQDVSARRNALAFLTNHDPDRAVSFLSSQADKLIDWGAILQMSVVELIRKVCRTKPTEKGKYIKIILALMGSKKPAVVYDCATTLVALSQAPTAIRAAANCFCQLLVSHSDNNVKLIVLDRLRDLKLLHADVLSEMLMDVLRALAAPAFDIRRKILDLAMELITPKSVAEVVSVLKKELMRTQTKDLERNGEYRQVLVQCVHKCAVKHPDVAAGVVHILMEFLGDSQTVGVNFLLHVYLLRSMALKVKSSSVVLAMQYLYFELAGKTLFDGHPRQSTACLVGALDVAVFVREMMEMHPGMHEPLLQQLRVTFPQLQSPRVYTTVLWMMAEYSSSAEDVECALDTILTALGPPPFGADLKDAPEPPEEDVVNASSPMAAQVRPQVLADGTYATQAAVAEAPVALSAAGDAAVVTLRSLIITGDTFLGAVVCVTLVKLLLRLQAVHANNAAGQPVLRRRKAEVMLVMVGLLKLAEERSGGSVLGVDKDSRDRIVTCLHMLNCPSEEVVRLWLEAYRAAYSASLEEQRNRAADEADAKAAENKCQPDDPIDFAHLKHRRGVSQIELEDAVATDLQRATGLATSNKDSGTTRRTLQLTGLSDAVYAEAVVILHQYDVVLDVLVINRTKETLQNLCLELATTGDLKLVERPQNHTLSAGQSTRLRANIKVSSTETGVIFGNIVYETGGTADSRVVVLNDMHIDIMDYISPAPCADVAFRNFWAEFEWENKVAINTDFKDPRDFLDHIVKETNMKCLNPESSLAGDCGYLSANLYAKSVFGEDALVNLSVEKGVDCSLSGFLRIRAKSQGLALSLGDKITLRQKMKN